MSLQSQFKSNVLLEKIEPLAVIKNESEIGMDQDIISPDNIKDEIDIMYHIIPEDLIKSEPILNNLLESEHLGSVETQKFVQTENTPCLKTEFENLVKTEDTSDENLKSTPKQLHELSHKTERENQLLKYCCNQCKYKTFKLESFTKHNKLHLKPEEILYFYCYHCSYKAKQKFNLRRHIFNHFKNEKIPFHCYICDFVTPKRNLIIEHFKKHPEHRGKCDRTENKNQIEACIKKTLRYYCKKCVFYTYQDVKLKLHELSHEAERDDQHLKYQCDHCKYKTFRLNNLNRHKLLHVKPIPYLCCYHCPYRCLQKGALRVHIFRHFKNEEVPFHCYICDFVTVNRYLIIEHFKEHPEHHSICDETDYKISLEVGKMDDRDLKYQCDKCTYKTFRLKNFKKHKLIHLKPEEIQYFNCYHCSYKAKQKSDLKRHILGHKNANFKPRKRYSITEHYKIAFQSSRQIQN